MKEVEEIKNFLINNFSLVTIGGSGQGYDIMQVYEKYLIEQNKHGWPTFDHILNYFCKTEDIKFLIPSSVNKSQLNIYFEWKI